jgi:hypothetical protein
MRLAVAGRSIDRAAAVAVAAVSAGRRRDLGSEQLFHPRKFPGDVVPRVFRERPFVRIERTTRFSHRASGALEPRRKFGPLPFEQPDAGGGRKVPSEREAQREIARILDTPRGLEQPLE